MRTFCLTLILLATTASADGGCAAGGCEAVPPAPDMTFVQVDDGAGISDAELAIANTLSTNIATSDWLGPLAPVALSPFFGVAALAAMAQFGPETLVESNTLLSANSPLHSGAVLWTFATLALLTSIPRLTKVSKPIAGALDQFEAYSSIITLVAVRFLAGEPDPAGATATVAIAGVGSASIEVVLSVAAAVNVIVINAVKFLFEFAVWVTPVPFLDACFEAANKAVVAGLMGLYAFSPVVATGLNLLLFVAAAVAFLWARRQIVFLRTILLGRVLSLFAKGSPPTEPIFTVFPKEDFGPFAARERLTLERTDEGFLLSSRSWPGRVTEVEIPAARGHRVEPGWVSDAVIFNAEPSVPLLLSKRTEAYLDVVAALLTIELAEGEFEKSHHRLHGELGREKRPKTNGTPTVDTAPAG